MYTRVVRFTDVDPDHMAARLADAEARDGPPVDIQAKGVQILHDSADTPGTRASIDRCEIKAELGSG